MKIIAASFVAEDTKVCGEKAHSSVSRATSQQIIKKDEGQHTLFFHHQISVELKNAAVNEKSRMHTDAASVKQK